MFEFKKVWITIKNKDTNSQLEIAIIHQLTFPTISSNHMHKHTKHCLAHLQNLVHTSAGTSVYIIYYYTSQSRKQIL